MDRTALLRAIRLARQDRGWSQEELADRVGVGRITIHRIECGKREPSLDVLFKMMTVLGMRLEVLDAATPPPQDNLPWFLDPAGNSESARKLRAPPAPPALPAPAPAPESFVTHAEFEKLLAEVAKLRREVRGE